MYNNTLMVILMISSIANGISQQSWSTIRIEGLGNISLPPNMEIQGGSYRTISDNLKEVNGISASKVIFQQKGLNARDENSFNTYARVFIRTERDYSGSYPKIGDFSITYSELNELNKVIKEDTYGSAASGNAKILTWYPAVSTSMNNQKCVSIGHKRKVGSNPPVLVNMYLFYNYDRIHILTFEYRISDEYKWKSTFDKIKKSVTIN